MRNSVEVQSGITWPSLFVMLLTLLFIGLKLGGVIDWSWLWVLAPLWIYFSLAVAFLIVFMVVFVTFLILRIYYDK